MKTVSLKGRYTHQVRKCHFEDIPIFFKMADMKEKNDKGSCIKVCRVSLGDNLILPNKILRWRIVKTTNKQLILAYRTAVQKEAYPCIYSIRYNYMPREIVLVNTSSDFSPFDRLRLWYHSIIDIL